MLFFSAVSPEALELLREIQNQPVLKDFYLVVKVLFTSKMLNMTRILYW